jgi:uncharacterized membrane protein
MSEQTEAQRLADELVALHGYPLSIRAAAELRRLDAELERKSDAIQRLWAERDSLRTSMAQLLEALKDIAYQLEKARIWGGMDWHYNPLHPIHYLPARDKARAAIAAAKEQA